LIESQEKFHAQKMLELLIIQHTSKPEEIRDKYLQIISPRIEKENASDFLDGVAQIVAATGDKKTMEKIAHAQKVRDLLKQFGGRSN